MKRLRLVVLAAALATAGAAAAPVSVVLYNPEAEYFYYLLDPPELAGFEPVSSVFASVLYDFFSEQEPLENLQKLPPRSIRRLSGLSEGYHLVVGFFARPGAESYPVRALKVQAGGGIAERFYTMYASSAAIEVRPGQGRLAGFAPDPAMEGAAGEVRETGAQAVREVAPEPPLIRVDGKFEDWDLIPPLASFALDYPMVSFTREQYGSSLEPLPIAAAQHWHQGGTDLNELKAVRAPDALYLFVSSHSAISENLTVELYFFKDRTLGRSNSVTLELVPPSGTAPGMPVLWRQGQKPRLAGELAASAFFMEARVEAKEVLAAMGGEGSFDLTTVYFDRNELSYEEFYLGTYAVKDVPRSSELR